MEKLVACCGLDCNTCDARIATINNDNDLRAKTAETWRVQHNAVGLTPEMINCTGCMQPGVKFNHCNVCEIRNCAISKNFSSCGECSELDSCSIVGGLHKFVPDALANLKSLN